MERIAMMRMAGVRRKAAKVDRRDRWARLDVLANLSITAKLLLAFLIVAAAALTMCGVVFASMMRPSG